MLSDILKKRRSELHLTLLDIAKQMGVSEATVQRWESGNIKSLRHGRIVKLAEILQCNPIDLIDINFDRKEDETTELSEKEKIIVYAYRKADARGQIRIERVVDEILEEIEKNNIRSNGESACG